MASVKERPLKRYTASLSDLAGSRQVFAVSLVLLVIAVIIYSQTLPDDYDMWWHLRYGEHYVNGHTWAIDDGAFSWTPTHSRWIYGTWAGSALIYLIHSAAGINGLICFRWLANLSVFIFFLLYIRRTGEKLSIIHLAAFALVAAAFKLCGTYLKPERASDILFAALLFIYFLGKSGRERLFLLLPLLFLIWVNVHGAFVTGLMLLTIAVAGEILSFVAERLLRLCAGQSSATDGKQAAAEHCAAEPLSAELQAEKNTAVPRAGKQMAARPAGSLIITALSARGLVTLTVSAALSFAVTAINPTGLRYPLSILEQYTTRGSAADLAVQRLWAWTSMWSHLFPAPAAYRFYFTVTAWAILIMAVLFFTVWAAQIVRRRCADPAVLLLNVVFFLFAMSLCRATLYYPSLWLFSIFYLLDERWRTRLLPGATISGSGRLRDADPDSAPAAGKLSASSREAGALLSSQPFPTVISMFLFYLFVGIMLHIGIGYGVATEWQGRLDRDFVPRDASEFVLDNRLPAPVFNDYLTGGYLMWSLYPDYKVFVDPRQFPYMKEVLPDYLVFRDSLRAESLQALQQKYPFRTAIIHHLQEPAMVALFMRSPRFRMVYFDECAAVFVDRRDYDALPESVKKADLSPKRFAHVKNTDILISLFMIYLQRDADDARQIAEYYRKNVPGVYRMKSAVTRWMKARAGTPEPSAP
jgi:hypothetical protein